MPDDRLARALGSRVRRDILKILLEREASVCAVASRLGLTEVNSSKHLKKLFDLGLVETRVEGRKRFYSIKHHEIRGLIKHFEKVSRALGRGIS
jgi:DNA-binding transcriptional ArsR family regulator